MPDDVFDLTEEMVALVEETRNEIDTLLTSSWLGCYSCLLIFRPQHLNPTKKMIRKWIRHSAIHCPRCRGPHVVGDGGGMAISRSLLVSLRRQYRPPNRWWAHVMHAQSMARKRFRYPP